MGTLPINVVRTDSVGPVTVVTKELMMLAEMGDEVVVEVRVALSTGSAVEPLAPGEQPTKFGADSLTALQDAMLNAMASVLDQCLCMLAVPGYLLCWSAGTHEVAKQQESALT